MSPPAAAGRAKGRARAVALPPTERKFVTLLRADIARSTALIADLELEEGLARLEPALEAMHAAVHAYGGVVIKQMGDGIFAAFGAPIAEDLHAVMACHAGLDLVGRVRALGDPALHVRVGLHSGQVVAGMAETDFSRAYDLGGPPLIMAERLQAAAASDQILASEACCGLADGYIRFGAGRAFDLKGFGAPVVAHVVEAVGELSKWRVNVTRGTVAFVGRAAEMERLRDIAARVETGRGGDAVALLGEPGVGKSRLARELMQSLVTDGWQAVEAECSPILGRTPFALLKALLRIAIETLGSDATATLRQGLAPAAAAALSVVLEEAPASPAWLGLTPRARGRAIAEAARALFAAVFVGRQTVLLIEDLQWADEASTPALDAIATLAATQPVLLLATARTGGLPAWFGTRAEATLSLRPLEAEDGLSLLDHLLGPSPRLDALKRRILAHTGALPLFVEEVCRGLVEAGVLTGRWGALEPHGDDADLGVPPTLQGVIASRIDRLAPPEKRLLQVAAVCGPRVPGRLLQVVAGLKEAVFRGALGALLGATMLVPASEAAAETVHGFPHELVRQVAYDAVLAPEKAALHARILAELEARAAAGDSGPDLAGALVHHAMMARDWSRAAEYAARIARECLARSALPDATRYFETAMEAVDRLPEDAAREARAVDLRIEARLAYANFGKVQRWLDLAREAEARAQAAGDDKRRVAALTVRAAALNFCGAPPEALEAGEAAVRAAAATGQEGWLGYAEYGLGQARYVAGEFRAGVEVLERAYRRFALEGAVPPVGGSGVQAALLCCMMEVLCRIGLGETEAAEAAQARADAIAASGRPFDAIAAGFSRGALLLHREQLAEAETTLGTALALAQQHEVNLFVPVVACQHGLALLRLGQVEEARRVLDLARDEAEALGHRSAGLRAELYRAWCEGCAADAAARTVAEEAVERVRRAARQMGYAPLEMEAGESNVR